LLLTHYGFDANRFIAPGSNPERGYAWFLGAQLGDESVVVLVAERAGRVVGYVYAGIEPQSWKELREEAGFIHDVVVEEQSRGLGIARLLVETASDWLRARGAPRVLLWSATQNTAAQRLFARLGFRQTMIEMTKELGADS
jgi:ribosomal protein S18 acetylase RimI-like enzyme